jgi:hypothetical protein
MKNYTFIKPYKTTIGSKDANALLIGAVPFQEINFKIGDKIKGSVFGGVDTNRVVETRIGNAYFNIPPEYLKEEAENQSVIKQLQPTSQIPAQVKKKSITSGNLNMLAKASIVPIGLYAFSKYKKYDNKKTIKVTIIGSVVVLGAIILNGFSGAWSGNSFMDRTFGQQKYW